MLIFLGIMALMACPVVVSIKVHTECTWPEILGDAMAVACLFGILFGCLFIGWGMGA